jgi:hypothetical protein
MADFPRYEPAAVRCSGVAQPGVEAFMEWAVRDFGRGAFNLGIYNCRTVRGSANRSVHGDGRAGDVGFPGVSNANGTALLNTLLPHVRELGIQLIIWDRRIWSAKAPLGARYQGTVPHTDHLHIEFTWNAARTLTRDRCRVVTGGRLPSTETPNAPAPPTAPSAPQGPSADDLRLIQRFLQEDDDMVIIRDGIGIALLVNGKCVGQTLDSLQALRTEYADANRPLVEHQCRSDAEWLAFGGWQPKG